VIRPFAGTRPGRGHDEDFFDEASGRIIGCGIVGASAGDDIARAALAIDIGADAADIALTIIRTPRSRRRSACPPRRSRAPSPTLHLPKRK